jgi:hypothetical protein
MKSKAGITALITGASAGIGLEIAKLHASQGGELVLVARRKDRLESIKADLEEKYKVKVTIISKDLSKRESPKEIYAELKKQKITVDYLINNAGFSQQGYFHEIDWNIQESMIMVNVMSMVELAYLILPEMVARKSGRILNVASSAAFAPGGPLQTIYFATKSFLVSFSQGLAGELEGSGVTSTVLCPGATATEFEKVSGLDKTNLFSSEKVFTAKEVAKDGYQAMLRGDLVKLAALSSTTKFVLKNMNLFPTKRILQQIKMRQEVK